VLIKTYGEFWNPFLTDWKAQRLDGKAKVEVVQAGKRVRIMHTINFWDAMGIYVLINDFKPVYVGQSGQLGKRLADHLTDRFAGRWDMFSWYSVCKHNITSGGVNRPKVRAVKMATLIDTLEAFGILVADPALNRKRERLPEAIEFDQLVSQHPQSVRAYLEAILAKL
jgi:hypothetical protein